MSYLVKYINCKVCGKDNHKFLGFRGNLEYAGAPQLKDRQHMITNTVKCRKCGFVYTNPEIIIPNEETRILYDRPEEYLSSTYKAPLKIFGKTLDIIERFIQHKGRLLDVGAGKGEFLAVARERGWKVYGIEPSENFVKYAKENFALNIPNTELEKAGFPPEYFDVVTLNMVLEHLDEPHRLIQEINRITKKQGLLYIEVPNMDSWLLKVITFYYRLNGKDWSPLLSPLHYPFHRYGYQKSSLSLICKMNKFKIEKFITLGINLRGFRFEHRVDKFKIFARSFLANIFSWINKGDILIAIAQKE